MKSKRIKKVCLILLLYFIWPYTFFDNNAEAKMLSPQEYIEQVKQNHGGYKGAVINSQGAKQRSIVGDLLTSPKLFSSLIHNSESSNTVKQQQRANRIITNIWDIGIEQETQYGLKGKIGYSLTYSSIEQSGQLNQLGQLGPALLSFFANPNLPNPYYEARPRLELSQPLWRNRMGSETRANQEVIRANALVSSYKESFLSRTKLLEAEQAYWWLVMLKDVVKIQQDSLERAIKIRNWNQQRVNNMLADRIDLLQAQAALDSRKLELQKAQDDVKEAARKFNTLRGLDNERVDEDLVKIEAFSIEKTAIPTRIDLRDDTKAMLEQTKALQAQANSEKEKVRPDLELFGNMTLNGERKKELADAMVKSFKKEDPSFAIGVRFTMPLDIKTISAVSEGYSAEQMGSALNYERKYFEQEREWKDLVERWQEGQKRLGLVKTIRSSQREKLHYERDRLSKGRTTTFQVIMFEQEYALSELSLTKAQFELIQLYINMKMFGGADESR